MILPLVFCDAEAALRFCPVRSCGSGGDASCFFFDALELLVLVFEALGISPIGAPGFVAHVGQNHSASGTAESGGSRQPR